MELFPIGDKVVVRLLEGEETVKGGIIIPDTAKEKRQEADVIAVGPGKLDENGKRAPMEVTVGDKVLINKYGGDEFKIEDDEYKVIGQDDILAVIKK